MVAAFFRNATSSWFSLSLDIREVRERERGAKFEQNLRPKKNQKTPRWSAEVTHLFCGKCWVASARVASTASCFQIRPHFPAFREEEKGAPPLPNMAPKRRKIKKKFLSFFWQYSCPAREKRGKSTQRERDLSSLVLFKGNDDKCLREKNEKGRGRGEGDKSVGAKNFFLPLLESFETSPACGPRFLEVFSSLSFFGENTEPTRHSKPIFTEKQLFSGPKVQMESPTLSRGPSHARANFKNLNIFSLPFFVRPE